MKTLVLALAALTLAAMVPTAAAAHVDCTDPGVVCLGGTLLLGWSQILVEVPVGTWIVWVSDDGLPHPVGLVGVNTQGGPILDTPHQSTNSESSWQVAHTGDIEFHCNIHPNMRGLIRAS